MDTNEKLNELRKYLADRGFTQEDIAKRFGVTKQAVNQLLTGRKPFGKLNAQRWANEFGLSAAWLLTGEGAMLESNLGNVEIMKTPTDGATPIYNLDATCGTDGRSIEFLQEHIIGYVNMPNVSKSASLIRANGDSMTPIINDGDFIAVREVTDFDDIFYGQIYLVITAQNRMVKYVRRYADDEGNYVLLRSENPNYDDIKMAKSRIIKMYMVENILSLQIRM